MKLVILFSVVLIPLVAESKKDMRKEIAALKQRVAELEKGLNVKPPYAHTLLPYYGGTALPYDGNTISCAVAHDEPPEYHPKYHPYGWRRKPGCVGKMAQCSTE